MKTYLFLAVLSLAVAASSALAGAVNQVVIEGSVDDFNAAYVKIITKDGRRSIPRTAVPSHIRLYPGRWLELSWPLEEAVRLRLPAPEKNRFANKE